MVRASTRYGASRLHRMLLGDAYRAMWATPIRVPFLDLQSYAGGLQPVKVGGGKQTKSLHLVAADGREFVFRPVAKELLVLPDRYRKTIVWDLVDDQYSALHPVAPLIAAPILAAAGVLHPAPELVVMPNDPRLAEFREQFAGVLGTIEPLPSVPDDLPSFAGASEIIDSDELLARLNKDPSEAIDARSFLTARLVDLLLNDNDRHPEQWKWARLGRGARSPWQPIPRDRDKALISYEGLLLQLARMVDARQVPFERTYPSLTGLFSNAIEFDRRLLAPLDKAVWDSVAAGLVRAINDSVILEALNTVPAEYRTSAPLIAAKLAARRDQLPNAASRYYRTLFSVADLHGTEAADRIRVMRSGEGMVEVAMASGEGPPHFVRHFRDDDTREVRVYLHGGDDAAVITGHVQRSILVRIIGGNGTNVLIDSSTVAGQRDQARLYDAGRVERWSYTADTIGGTSYLPDTAWNRRPWLRAYGTPTPPARDRGTTITPTAGFWAGDRVGFAPQVGLTRVQYGFRTVPYASSVSLLATHVDRGNRFKVELSTDHRVEDSRVHYETRAAASQLELLEFRGLGNDAPESRRAFYDVQQTQWTFRPAVSISVRQKSDVSLGPVVKYVTTDSLPGRFIAERRPYGFPRSGQAGVQLEVRHDTRDSTANPHSGVFAVASASAYPGLWNLQSMFARFAVGAQGYVTLPLPARPVLALRGGGEKLVGAFPFFEAASVGGPATVRAYEYRQFSGDASLFGTAELRVPIARPTFVLPLDVGLLGFVDGGRVFMHGKSPGGWHTAEGAGFWVGVDKPSTGLTVLFTNRRQYRTLLGLGFSF